MCDGECNCRSFWLIRFKSLALQSAYFHLCRFEMKKLQIFVLEHTYLSLAGAVWNFDLLLSGWLNLVETVKLSSEFYSHPQAVLVLNLIRAYVVKGVF